MWHKKPHERHGADSVAIIFYVMIEHAFICAFATKDRFRCGFNTSVIDVAIPTFRLLLDWFFLCLYLILPPYELSITSVGGVHLLKD